MHLREQLRQARPALDGEVFVEEEAARAGDELEPGRVLFAIPVGDTAALVDGYDSGCGRVCKKPGSACGDGSTPPSSIATSGGSPLLRAAAW